MNYMFIPLVLFMVIVAPIWIVMHYSHKKQLMKSADNIQREDVDALLGSIDQLIERVATLEDILDESQPSWRKDVRRKRGQ